MRGGLCSPQLILEYLIASNQAAVWMIDENEFEKPLKKRQHDATTSRRRIVVGGLLVAVICALPVVHFYDGWGKIAALIVPDNTQTEVANVVVPSDQKAIKNEDLPKAPREYQVDPEAGQLQEITTEEKLVPFLHQKLR